jgi:CBS domain-containing protein
MSPTMLETMAKEIMQPLPPSVTPQTLASEALETMRRGSSAFLPVVGGSVVTRESCVPQTTDKVIAT